MTQEQKAEEAMELIRFINEECLLVAKLEVQLNIPQAIRLLEKFPIEHIKRQLEKMDNYRLLAKKSRSVYHTLNNWFERDIVDGKYKLVNTNTGSAQLPTRRKIFEKFEEGETVQLGANRFVIRPDGSMQKLLDRSIMPAPIVEVYLNNIQKV